MLNLLVRKLVEQIIHDISGKTTVLSIMNELNYDGKQQSIIEEFINFILKYRQHVMSNENFDIKNIEYKNDIIEFLDNTILQSEAMLLKINDYDILKTIKSLILLNKSCKSIILNDYNIELIKENIEEKSIKCTMPMEINIPMEILLILSMIIKEKCAINIVNNDIIINNINYNFFKQNNGFLNNLYTIYNIENNFSILDSSIKISWTKF